VRRLPLLVLVLAGRALGAEPAPAVATPQQQFVVAMARVRQGLPDENDSPALRAYVIHDYLVAARLRRDLKSGESDELDGRIDGFLQAHLAEPVTRTLRHDWLASLARRGRWDWFLPRSVEVNDPALVCERLRGLLATGETSGLAAAALARWSQPQEPPTPCVEVFAWLRAQHFITPPLAAARVRAALVADNPRLAREFAAELPAAEAAPFRQWAAWLEAPEASLRGFARDPDATVEPEALVAAFTRLARTKSEAAAALLPMLLERPAVTSTVALHLRRAAALGAAYDHDPGAVAAFANLPLEPKDDLAEEWRVRAALWAGNFAEARAWIDAMSPALASTPRWKYWRARALAATGDAAAADALYLEVAGLRDYYGYLAADRVHRPYQLNERPTPADLVVERALAAQPGMLRAHALLDCDQPDEAAAEWAEVVGRLDAATKVQAARLASAWGWYYEAIATLGQAGDLDDVHLRYPRPFSAAVATASEFAKVPGDWLLAVMRQESLFRVDAVSRANARGLMQMLPSTAEAVARRWHLPPPPANGRVEPEVAIRLGAAYLRELLDHYGDDLPLALAAYNAGVAAVARWQPPAPLDADVWLENIPYNETRSYVEHALENIVAFAWVRDAPLPELKSLLPPVGGVTATP
jgi:soluble lytic murein transglycosylase